MTILTIGFTKKSAEEFFGKLQVSGARRLVDVRLNNVSQLSGFAKRSDLEYFLRRIGNIDYAHELLLAPTQEMLERYRTGRSTWSRYESEFLDLMRTRRIEEVIPKSSMENACLLCSEDKPQRCHRRLVAEYLRLHWGGVEIVHLT